MASETATREPTSTESTTTIAPWQAGLVGGLAGGLVFGAMMSAMMTPVMEMAIPALYGIEGPAGLAGWVIHMSNSAVLGVVFGILAGSAGLERSGLIVGVGLVYGAALWIALAAIVMPIWLGAVGFPATPPLPNVNAMSLVGHLAYGLVLGIVYASVR
ncbi:histidine kinase [Halalkalicoccus salilacus]|uniref:histidine kinase n=1 Tax=Halalkalicoccus salilacus TaxID=3117459 RepID=UPI00300EF0F8